MMAWMRMSGEGRPDGSPFLSKERAFLKIYEFECETLFGNSQARNAANVSNKISADNNRHASATYRDALSVTANIYIPSVFRVCAGIARLRRSHEERTWVPVLAFLICNQVPTKVRPWVACTSETDTGVQQADISTACRTAATDATTRTRRWIDWPKLARDLAPTTPICFSNVVLVVSFKFTASVGSTPHCCALAQQLPILRSTPMQQHVSFGN
jgi:hypothetical protein